MYRCKNKLDYQDKPKNKILLKNMNKSLKELKDIIKNNENYQVYAYVLSTLEYKDSKIYQTGSAPNFQGKCITLCTCKHNMRSWKKKKDWKNTWIAGFTSINFPDKKENKNYLFYLMQVKNGYGSHKEIYESLKESIKLKNATDNKHGDIYKPKQEFNFDNDSEKWLNPHHYYKPDSNHNHAKNYQWHHDILPLRNGKKPILLEGEPKFSFLWSKPIIYHKKMPRTKKFDNMKKFMDSIY